MQRDPYRLAAPIYDLATAAWTGGAIWRSRVRCLEGLKPDETVLIPGAGSGRLVALAASRGARVTALEPSPSMGRRLRRRLRRAGALAEVLDAPLEQLEPTATFDLVVAEHFLNVFRPSQMAQVRAQLVDRVRPGGRFAIADFTPVITGEHALAAGLKGLYHALPLGGCALLTANALHRIYDHGADLARDGRLVPLLQEDAGIFGVGPAYFRSWIWKRREPGTLRGKLEGPWAP